jgi:hypothetical protein
MVLSKAKFGAQGRRHLPRAHPRAAPPWPGTVPSSWSQCGEGRGEGFDVQWARSVCLNLPRQQSGRSADHDMGTAPRAPAAARGWAPRRRPSVPWAVPSPVSSPMMTGQVADADSSERMSLLAPAAQNQPGEAAGAAAGLWPG